MQPLTRLILFLCVFAGMGAGFAHSALHEGHEECVSHCDSGHDPHGEQHDHDHDHEPGTQPHDHGCCHLPSADRATDSLSLPAAFVAVLLEISADRSLVPDEPVFALDKPPLI